VSAQSRNSRITHSSTRASRFSQTVNIVSVCIATALVVWMVFGAGVISTGDFGVNKITKKITPPPVLNKFAYDARMLALARSKPYTPFSAVQIQATSTTKIKKTVETLVSSSNLSKLWPVKTTYPNYGAIFPFSRVVAYYGNFYSTKMGVLGEYPREEVIEKLEKEVTAWHNADPTTSVIPAIDYIVVTAQANAGKDGKYRLRMPDSQIDKALSMAKEVHGILILDVQVGLSTLQKELPLLVEYLKQPNVELAIDPEFSMVKSGMPPGKVIGTFDADDINYATEYLARLVRLYRLPPKFLVVHRFTEAMVTNYKKIKPLSEVQVVMDMDGWGSPSRKRRTYRDVIYKEPVQFAGIKIFYKNDIKPPSNHMMTPKEVLNLTPRPVFIQYQ